MKQMSTYEASHTENARYRMLSVLIKRPLEIVIIVLAFTALTILFSGGYRINLGFAELSLTSLRRICLYLAFAFSVRLILSDWLKYDSFIDRVRKITSSRLFPLCFLLSLTVIFVTVKIFYTLTFINWARDISVYEYAFFNTLKGRFMYSPFLNKCYFAEHFSPLLLTALPFYAVIPSKYTLIIWQSVLLAGAVIPALYLTQKLWDDSISSTFFTVGLVTSSAFSLVLTCDVHQEAAYPLLFLTSIIALLSRRKGWFMVSILLLLTVKEDAPIYAGFIAISAIIYRRWWKVGIICLTISISYWFATIYVIMPAFGSKGFGPPQIISRWGQYGSSIVEIAIWLLTHPVEVMRMIFRYEVLRFIPQLIFTPLFSPWVLITLPYLLIHATSNMEIQYNFTAYFGAPSLTLFAIASVYGIKNISSWLGKLRVNKKKVILFASMAVMIINIGHLNLVHIDRDTLIARKILSQIPDDASLSAQEHIFPHLPPRREIHILPEIDSADYVFIDTGLFSGIFSRTDAIVYLRDLVIKGEYEVIEKGGNRFYLLKRKDDVMMKETINN